MTDQALQRAFDKHREIKKTIEKITYATRATTRARRAGVSEGEKLSMFITISYPHLECETGAQSSLQKKIMEIMAEAEKRSESLLKSVRTKVNEVLEKGLDLGVIESVATRFADRQRQEIENSNRRRKLHSSVVMVTEGEVSKRDIPFGEMP
jgi:hypothetical protein